MGVTTRIFQVVYICRLFTCEIFFVFIPERTVFFRLVTHSKFVSNFDSDYDFDSDAYFAVVPPETPISLRPSL